MVQKFFATPDRQSGLFFTAFGALVAWQATEYPIGKASQMGPGFFPLLLGGLLFLVGLIITLRSFRSEHEAAPPFAWRSAFLVTVAIVASAMLLLTAGLLVAVPVLVVIASLAAREHPWRSILITTVALTGLAYLIFIVGLGLRIPLYWG